MSDLLADSQAASAWVQETIAKQPTNGVFGDFLSGVIWSDNEGWSDGRVIPLDPNWLSEINAEGFPLLLNHDPGQPIGKVVAAEMFTALDGRKFVAAILGFYRGGEHKGFSDFGFDRSLNPAPPTTLPLISKEMWIDLATDPREVDAEWVDRTAEGAPLFVKKRPLSHNALEATQEIIRIGLPYLILVWNPFVTAIASEAGKDTYKALRGWFSNLIERVSELRNPIVVVQSFQDDCEVSFIFRGNDVEILIAARDALPIAAVQAKHLIGTLRRRDAAPKTLTYEFDKKRNSWGPSYAELHDGRFITDNRELVMVTDLPNGLSLGIIGSGSAES